MTQFAGDDAHYLKDLRTDLGTLRAPLQGYVLNFDGTDDYGTLGGRITTGGPTAISAFAWIKTSGTDETIFSEYDTLSQRCWLLQVMTSTGKLRMVLSNNGTSTYNLDSLEAVNDGEWHHVGFSYDGTSDAKIFIDGVDVTGNASSGGTFVTSLLDTSADFVIGALNSGGGSFFGGEIKDVRVYSSAKSEAQTQGIMAGTIDDTDILGHWWGNDKSGTVLRDRSGNGNHLTATNITESTFHLADPTVVNPANSEGYSQNYVGPNSYRDIEVIPAGSLPQTLVDVSCKVKNPNSDNKFAMFGSTGSSVALGLSESGSALLPNLNSGTITTKVDGVIVATRGDLHTAISDGSEHTVLFENVDFSASASWDGGLYVGGFNSASWVLDGVQIWDITIDGVTYPVGDIIPAVDATTDALGNTLQYQGNAPFPIRADTPCITGDGTSVYADLASALIPATADFSIEVYYYHVANSAAARYLLSQRDTGDNIIGLLANFNGTGFTGGVLCFYVDDNTTPSFTTVRNLEAGNWHKITASRVSNLFTLTCTPIGSAPATGTFTRSITLHTANNSILLRNGPISALYNDGRLADLQITTGGVTTTFPLQEGEGRDLGWWATDGTKGVLSGAIVGGTLANIWANLCPGLVKDHSILYGGGIDGVTGAFVPGDPNSANDVAGNPKTLPAGNFGNPHSRLQFNPFAVQEITAINGESDYVAGTFRHLVAPADTKYADTSTDGTSSTLISVSGALTGADKTNTETYVNIPAIPANMITIGGSTPITIDNTQYVVIGS